MSLSQHPKAYGSAALTIAFVAGILVTLGFKDIYPDLERRYQRHKRSSTLSGPAVPPTPASTVSPAELRRRSWWSFNGPVRLEDHDDQPVDNDKPITANKETNGTITAPPSTPSPSASEPSPSPNQSLPAQSTGIESTIGNTPLLLIPSLTEATGRTILAKAEYLNGAGSSPKDRVALSMILAAEKAGHLVPNRGDTIYEGTTGSTGISLATLARARGYTCHITMPDDQSVEKSDLLKVLGATVERVPLQPITSPEHFVNLARRRAEAHTMREGEHGSRGFFANQFESEANWKAHFEGTGPEIWSQTLGKIDAFVAGSGTGGTISGVAKYLKSSSQAGGHDGVKIVLADPEGSGLFNKVKYGVMYSPTEREGTRRRQQVDTIVEGIGLTRLTSNFETGRELIDDAVKVTDEQACRMAKWLVEHDGIFAGSSSAVNCVAAVLTAMTLPEGSTVVTILCDSGQRHLSRFYKRVAEIEAEVSDHGEKEDIFTAIGLQPSS